MARRQTNDSERGILYLHFHFYSYVFCSIVFSCTYLLMATFMFILMYVQCPIVNTMYIFVYVTLFVLLYTFFTIYLHTPSNFWFYLYFIYNVTYYLYIYIHISIYAYTYTNIHMSVHTLFTQQIVFIHLCTFNFTYTLYIMLHIIYTSIFIFLFMLIYRSKSSQTTNNLQYCYLFFILCYQTMLYSTFSSSHKL